VNRGLGQTGNTDLLVTVDGRWRLVEVKSASGGASEGLVADALRHLSTWPQFRPDIAVEGITLIVSSQARLHPLNRTPAVYTRREFVESLTIPVVGIMDLFNAWRTRGFRQHPRSRIGGADSRSQPYSSRTCGSGKHIAAEVEARALAAIARPEVAGLKT